MFNWDATWRQQKRHRPEDVGPLQLYIGDPPFRHVRDFGFLVMPRIISVDGDCFASMS